MPRVRSALLGVLLSALLPTPAIAAPTDSPGPSLVRTDRGVVRGVATEAGRAFYAIPYAAPPIGDLRWRSPRPATAWRGVRDATTPGPACAQEEAPPLGTPRITTEDCLYLNVYTPAGRYRPRPVMVWFHGGGFTSGSNHFYDGSALADRGTVVVTINYRLGAFGFLAHPALSREDPARASGNYGTLDQQAALRWVRHNAAAFGGDPDRVTIFGESAGGLSVCAHLASPRAAGLFDRAIVQSGPCVLMRRPLRSAESAGGEFATRANCTTEADVLACLRSLPAAAVLDAMGPPAGLGDPLSWSPTSATPVLPADPAVALASGAFHRVPVVVGTTLDEGRVFAAIIEAAGTPLNAGTYPLVLTGLFGADAARVATEYPGSAYDDDYRLALGAVLTDALFACPALAMNQELSTRTRTYAYEFADRTAPNVYQLSPDFPLGAYHAAELPYLFPSEDVPLDDAQRRLSDRMLAYWGRFAATGNPENAGGPYWRRFLPARPVVLTLDRDEIRIRTGFGAAHRCAFWAAQST